MSGLHAFLAFSFSPVWGNCAVAPTLAAMNPQPETEESREGDAVHWYSEQLVKGVTTFDGSRAPNGVIITDVLRDCATMFFFDVMASNAKYPDPHAIGGSEITVQAKRIHADHCYGTPDYFRYSALHKRLVITENKAGHKEVSEFENYQMISQAAGILDTLRIDGKAEQELTVEMRIVQPRCFQAKAPIRVWTVNAAHLRAFWNHLNSQAEKALGANPEAVTGDHCFYCPGRHACSAYRKAAMASVDYAGNSNPEILTPEAVGYELALLDSAIDRMKGRRGGLEEQAKAFIKSGTLVPGWGLEPASGHLKWMDGFDPCSLEQAFGIPMAKPAYITPTQALAKGIDNSVIKACTTTPINGTKLVKQDSTAIRRILGVYSHG